VLPLLRSEDQNYFTPKKTDELLNILVFAEAQIFQPSVKSKFRSLQNLAISPVKK